jgi:hypothetical protein
MSTLSAVSPVAAKVALTVELKEAREMAAFYRGRVQFLRAAVKEVRLDNKIARSAARAEKAAARDAKRAERVAKLEAKLLALKTGPVGTKARAAARKPSKVVVRKA